VWETTHSKPAAFFDVFERKGGDLKTTHYCPGCGHGVLHKLIAEAIVDLGIQDRTILVNPVGCAVFAYYYLDIGHVQASHGRAPAVATGIKRTRPQSIVLCYQGDGDLAAIGGNEILHAANRGENISVFFVNNGIYGMTGGQMAPTTPLGARTVTSPLGRAALSEGYPLRISELLATLDAPVYIERVALTDTKHHMRARKAVRRAIQNQIEGRGFSLVEVLATCPTGWKQTPVEAVHWVEKNMIPAFPLRVFKDRAKDEMLCAARSEPVVDVRQLFPSTSVQTPSIPKGAIARGEAQAAALKISGFGGQGVLFLGIALAEAGIREGLQVSWIPSYGPEMRGGTAHCHVRLSRESISSPLVDTPSVVMAFNEPSVERFMAELAPGGLLLANSSMGQKAAVRPDINVLWIPATEAAKDLGNPRVANMVMLGAYVETTRVVDPESILASLAAHGMGADLLRQNRLALQFGRGLALSTSPGDTSAGSADTASEVARFRRPQ
jgi:2-oxoisovalerate ferredoxin oxidoreductase beta subunit